MRKCSVCNSADEVWNYKSTGVLYCPNHYHEMYNYGEIRNLNGRRKKNKYIIKGNTIEFITTNDEMAYIDKKHKYLLDCFYWGLNSQGYLQTRAGNKLVRMHHALLGQPINLVIDHINRNKKDNREENLRICTQLNNSRNFTLHKNNSSGIRGVSKVKSTGKWRARISIRGKEINLGHYEKLEDAKKAREKGEEKYFKNYSPKDY